MAPKSLGWPVCRPGGAWRGAAQRDLRKVTGQSAGIFVQCSSTAVQCRTAAAAWRSFATDFIAASAVPAWAGARFGTKNPWAARLQAGRCLVRRCEARPATCEVRSAKCEGGWKNAGLFQRSSAAPDPGRCRPAVSGCASSRAAGQSTGCAAGTRAIRSRPAQRQFLSGSCRARSTWT